MTAIALSNLTMPAWAVDTASPSNKPMMNMNPSKEDREKLAKAHEQMATCLRSDQELNACHELLRKECQSTMGESCQGMGMGDGMHKRMKYKK